MMFLQVLYYSLELEFKMKWPLAVMLHVKCGIIGQPAIHKGHQGIKTCQLWSITCDVPLVQEAVN